MPTRRRRLLGAAIALAVCSLAAVALGNTWVSRHADGSIFATAREVPKRSFAIVPGLVAELDTDDQRAHFDHLHGQLDEVVKGMLDWIPLFRMPSHPQLGLTFWDAGTLNVMIHREALSALRFGPTVATIAT